MACWLCDICDSTSNKEELSLFFEHDVTRYPECSREEALVESPYAPTFEAGILKRNTETRKIVFIDRWAKLSPYDLQFFKSKISELMFSRPVEVITLHSIERIRASKKGRLYLLELMKNPRTSVNSVRSQTSFNENDVLALESKDEQEAWIKAFHEVAGIAVESTK